MLRFFSPLLFILALFTTTARAEGELADIVSFKLDPVVENGVTYQAEILVGVAETEGELTTLEQFFANDLKAAVAKNPQLEINVASGDFATGREGASFKRNLGKIAKTIAGPFTKAVNVVWPEEQRKAFTQKFNQWMQKKTTLVCIRFFANGGAASWSVLAAGIPPEVAIPAGILTGAMSGTLQYFSEKVQRFLLEPYLLSRVLKISPTEFSEIEKAVELPESASGLSASGKKKLKVKLALLKALKGTETLGKPFAMEYIFTGVVKFSVATGMYLALEKGIDIGGVFTQVTYVTAAAYAAQAGWDLSVAKTTRKAKEEALNKMNNEDLAAKIQARSNIKVMLVSMLSVGGMCAELMHLPMADVGLWTMAVGGWSSYIYVSHKERFKSLINRCSKFLSSSNPPTPPSEK